MLWKIETKRSGGGRGVTTRVEAKSHAGAILMALWAHEDRFGEPAWSVVATPLPRWAAR